MTCIQYQQALWYTKQFVCFLHTRTFLSLIPSASLARLLSVSRQPFPPIFRYLFDCYNLLLLFHFSSHCSMYCFITEKGKKLTLVVRIRILLYVYLFSYLLQCRRIFLNTSWTQILTIFQIWKKEKKFAQFTPYFFAWNLNQEHTKPSNIQDTYCFWFAESICEVLKYHKIDLILGAKCRFFCKQKCWVYGFSPSNQSINSSILSLIYSVKCSTVHISIDLK